MKTTEFYITDPQIFYSSYLSLDDVDIVIDKISVANQSSIFISVHVSIRSIFWLGYLYGRQLS